MYIFIDIVGSVPLILFYNAYRGNYKLANKDMQKRVGLIGMIISILFLLSPIIYGVITKYIS
ncbi:hypothetical protein [Anaerorhabdus furcosa]|uniref:Uncharacterized protein n=1 Tax=Anaerorhabdus furcosa TaxID=118967 RepID=A0A1T4PC38_9FIRM|nr:hypothetical protein [Anaerorhabdus furcosa]SJZ89120.1 hypothetical protein SAMN02745191_1940 [Anaerorhabdus furcosa]